MAVCTPSIHPFQQHRMLFSNNWRIRNCFRFWDPYWGFSTIMTNADQAEALIVTVHSRAATDTEILNTEFVACYLAAKTALDYDSDHQELKKAPTGTQGSLRRKWTEYNMLGFRSPMRGLPVSSTYAPSATPYLLPLI
jgi:hypothetical protein